VKFHFEADCEFEAEDLDDAFWKIAKHFLAMEHSEDSDFMDAGIMDLRPVEEKDDEPDDRQE
jgi:hypothetical protein